MAIAGAISLVNHLISADPEEAARNLAKAEAIYRRVAAADPSNADALLGLATRTSDPAEKLQLLRRVMELKPAPHIQWTVQESLVRELERSGRAEDLLEAAEVAERTYAATPGTRDWRLADRATRLYERAGASARAISFRQRALQDLGADSLLAELNQVHKVDQQRAVAILTVLCSWDVAKFAGAESCIRGFEITLPGLAKLEDRDGARRIAAAAVSALPTIRGFAGGPSGSDAGLPARLDKLWDELVASGFSPANVEEIRQVTVLVLE